MTSPSIEDPFLTVDQIAQIFQVKPYTVRQWLKTGKMKGVKLEGNQWRVQRSEMQRYANKLYGEVDGSD